jgi:hypothetical protein
MSKEMGASELYSNISHQSDLSLCTHLGPGTEQALRLHPRPPCMAGIFRLLACDILGQTRHPRLLLLCLLQAPLVTNLGS